MGKVPTDGGNTEASGFNGKVSGINTENPICFRVRGWHQVEVTFHCVNPNVGWRLSRKITG